MKKRGIQYLEKSKTRDSIKLYNPTEAIKLMKEMKFAKFDETVEVHFRLGINPRHAEEQLRGTLVLPHGSGKKVVVAVIAEGEAILEAKEAGADFVGGDDLIEKIQSGWFDFDILVATPNVMSKVGRLGKLLGGKGLMPNPKSGTVTPNIAKAVQDFKAGKINYRNDKTGILHVLFGKMSFTEDQLKDNFETIYSTIEKVKPSKSKGVYLKSISISSTMGPGIFVEPQKLKWKES
ncbi:50S ribosomal protein L1 [Candidatus Margulisiibacteriota bacterium]